MNSIVVVKNNIDVNPFVSKLYDNWKDWNYMDDQDRVIFGHNLEQTKIVPLITVKNSFSCKVKDNDKQVSTEFLEKYSEVKNLFKSIKVKKPCRTGFVKMNPGAVIKPNVDDGNYYKTRDRYFLPLQSTYHMLIGGNLLRLDPGVLYWFNHHIPYGMVNVGNTVGISLMFDALHNKNNPHHFIN